LVMLLQYCQWWPLSLDLLWILLDWSFVWLASYPGPKGLGTRLLCDIRGGCFEMWTSSCWEIDAFSYCNEHCTLIILGVYMYIICLNHA
jgi:hypothetical protein